MGPQAAMPRRLASGGTAVEAGEPIHQVTPSRTSGVTDTNVWVLVAVDSPIVGTHAFGGVSAKNSLNASAGTTNAQEIVAACPVPGIGRVRGKAKTVGNIDTLSEIINITGDYTLFDWNSTGASDGGELYTIIETATADTSGLEIIEGNPATQTLDVTVAATIYRFEVS
ncbi:hypothetical protein LCGC14_1942880 [marine sediment metagenome]|uniref:Uncharacterized protein n=1 Tax=marine sediment metagenome TaxID=412755 RepID=A0A0F9FK15_9ZZZZ